MTQKNKSNILIVDDSPDNVYLLEVILQGQNYATVSATNGLEAIEAVKDNNIDLILMDVMMPEMNGFDASRHIRNMKVSEHIPIIMLTAKKRDTEDVLRGLGEGAVEYITKPFDEAELLARVKSMLRIKHLHDRNHELLNKLLSQQKLMDVELKMAAQVQKAMLPSRESYTLCKQCKIDTYYQATASIGGDFYDFLEYGDNKVGFFIADVSGHGPAAALIVAIVKTLLTNESHKRPSPAKMLAALNEKLCDMIPEDQFVTMFFCIVDCKTSTLTYSCGGHPPLFLFGKNRAKLEELKSPGMVVGIFSDASFSEESIKLKKGDKLMLYSDGLYETVNADGEQYGMDRMKKYITANSAATGKEIIGGMVKEIETFWDGETLRDDVAAVLVEFT